MRYFVNKTAFLFAIILFVISIVSFATMIYFFIDLDLFYTLNYDFDWIVGIICMFMMAAVILLIMAFSFFGIILLGRSIQIKEDCIIYSFFGLNKYYFKKDEICELAVEKILIKKFGDKIINIFISKEKINYNITKYNEMFALKNKKSFIAITCNEKTRIELYNTLLSFCDDHTIISNYTSR